MDLTRIQLPELHELAKRFKIRGTSRSRKTELRIILNEYLDEHPEVRPILEEYVAKAIYKRADMIRNRADRPRKKDAEISGPDEDEAAEGENVEMAEHEISENEIAEHKSESVAEAAAPEADEGEPEKPAAEHSAEDGDGANESQPQAQSVTERREPPRYAGYQGQGYRQPPEAPRRYQRPQTTVTNPQTYQERQQMLSELDSGVADEGVLEIMAEGFGFLRCDNYIAGPRDIYVSPSQIKRFNLRNGDLVRGQIRVTHGGEKSRALLIVKEVNGDRPETVIRRPNFEDLTPIFPDERLVLETKQNILSTRLIDLISPVGKGQRGMIVAQPKAGKTVLLKEIAHAVSENHKDAFLIVLLIDERPEEVTDMKRSIENPRAHIVYSTFDEQPDHHKRVAEMALERAKRLVEQGKDCIVLLDSITRLARAYNLIVPTSGKTLSGGLDSAALYSPKKFFGAARNIDGGGSLTILATALVDTGSKMDDVIFEEFKGTGNMELALDRRLADRRVFPAIDLVKSGTRRDDLLLSQAEQEALFTIRKWSSTTHSIELAEQMADAIKKTRSNADFVKVIAAMDRIRN